MTGLSDEGLGYYVLDGDHRLIWELVATIEKRRVGHDKVGDVTVSTVFLGVDHGSVRQPLYFETMTFGGKHDQVLIARYPTWESAVRGHRTTVTRLRAGYHPVP